MTSLQDFDDLPSHWKHIGKNVPITLKDLISCKKILSFGEFEEAILHSARIRYLRIYDDWWYVNNELNHIREIFKEAKKLS